MNQQLQQLLLPSSARLIDGMEVIKRNHSRCAIVVSGEKVVGVISEGDILRALLRSTDVHAPVADWVNHSFKFLTSRDTASALELMRTHGITLVPILDRDFRLTDVITLFDVLAAAQFSSTH